MGTTSRLPAILYHILGCIIFFTFPMMLSPKPAHIPMWEVSAPFIRDMLANGFMLVFFYLNYYILIPSLYFKKKYVSYAGCLILALLVITVVPSLLSGRIPWMQESAPTNAVYSRENFFLARPGNASFIQEIQHNVVLFVAVVLFSILLRVQNRLFQIEIGKQRDELQYLKAQMNPHFLFNTLNSIYALAMKEKAHATATGMIKLSSIMRYVVTDSNNHYVPLEKEINYINDYIDLQKMRLPSRVQLVYSVTGTMAGYQIAPHNLMPFIENAFKYGVNPDEDSSINVALSISAGQLKLIVENIKVHVHQDPTTKREKGIENTKLRLQLLYPDKHSLILSEDENLFRVQLTLDLT